MNNEGLTPSVLFKLPSFFSKFFTIGHVRSLNIKKNIVASFLLKGISIIISLVLVPLTLNYIDPVEYGIWLTLNSIITWFGIFDIGFGNGLRNNFAKALAKGSRELAKVYVSTTYAVLMVLMGFFYIVFVIVNPLLDWTKIMNTTSNTGVELSKLAIIVFTLFSLRFIFKLIGTILLADQKSAINDSFDVIGNFFALIIIYILTKTTAGSLLYFSTCLSATPVIVLLIANIYFFSGDYKEYIPSIKYVDLKYIRDLTSIGIQFFILQIVALIVFLTDNIIITQLFGPAEVTPYNIAFKYFNIIIMVFTTILNPFWSAFTESYHKGDVRWIQASINKLLKIWLLIVIVVVFMILFSKIFYHVWVGDKIRIPFLLSSFMGLYVVISTWNNIFTFFINGIGAIRLQMYYAIFAAIINIPLSIYFARNLNFGISGVILATCASILCGTILAPIQYKKIINNRAKGIWRL